MPHCELVLCLHVLDDLVVAILISYRVVKLSSPYLNVLIVVGVIMFYVDVILFGVDEARATKCTVDALCMVRMLRLKY